MEETSLGQTEIEFNRLIARMIVGAWYPTMQYKLRFGIFDNLKISINHIALKYKFSANCNDGEFLEFLCKNEDGELKKRMRDLALNVPYRLLSPFFSEKLRGEKDSSKNKLIIKLSLASDSCLYKIVKGKEDKIVLNDGWVSYVNENYRVMKSWIYYKLVCFLQKRNSNVLAIAFKWKE